MLGTMGFVTRYYLNFKADRYGYNIYILHEKPMIVKAVREVLT